MADNDPLAPLPPHDPLPASRPIVAGDGPLVCEFCECQLTPRGHALALSAKAKKWRDHSDDVAKLEKRIADLETELREANNKLAGKAVKKGFLD